MGQSTVSDTFCTLLGVRKEEGGGYGAEVTWRGEDVASEAFGADQEGHRQGPQDGEGSLLQSGEHHNMHDVGIVLHIKASLSSQPSYSSSTAIFDLFVRLHHEAISNWASTFM